MTTSEKFCLRWNDFERNISSAFKDIRDEKEFFDVTIACEDEQLQAHKVILSACSPFFRSVLRRNQPSSQQGSLVLYLKGVTYRDMESVLNFMYHGEVNVAQDDLNSFLAVAEELRVKGLTQSNSNSAPAALPSAKPSPQPPAPRRRPSDHQDAPSQQPAPKRPRPPPPAAPRPPVQALEEEDEVQEFVPVKTEPMGGQQQEMYQDPVVDQAQQGGMMMTTEDSLQYDESYGAYEEEGYDESAYYQEGGEGAGAGAGAGLPATHEQCPYCLKSIHKSTIKRHIKNQHEGSSATQCTHPSCGRVFKNETSMKDHLRQRHGVYQSETS